MRTTPILYVGPPGVGKTEAQRSKYEHCEVLLLSSCYEETIAGLPYRNGDKERRTTPLFIEHILEAVNRGLRTCIFLDELDKARREVADTLLTLITHPQHFNIPDCVDIVAAANPPEWGGGDGISKPMLSRFSVIEYKPSVERWCKWLTDTYQQYNPEFIGRLTDAILQHKIPLLDSVGEDFRFRLTCPRTYELAVRACLFAREDVDLIVRGLLTTNAASYILTLVKSNSGSMADNTREATARQVGATILKSNLLRI
jgi:replication-associated recombination protein RarA